MLPVRVLEETECTPRPFNEVTTYRSVVRAKGANEGWQGIQGLAAVGSHYHWGDRGAAGQLLEPSES